MRVKFIRDEWYPFYVKSHRISDYDPGVEYEISPEDMANYEHACRTLSDIFEKLNKQYDERQTHPV
jgi:hypothetical protein